MKFLPFLMGILLVSSIAETSCAQRGTDIVSTDEASVRFEHIFQAGETKIYSVRLNDIPRAPAIPSAYRSTNNKNYLVRSKAVVSGDDLLTLKVSADDENSFNKLKILRLTANELVPSGTEWQDCTVALRTLKDGDSETVPGTKVNVVDEYNQRMRDFMPNFAKRSVSCDMGDYRGEGDIYFAVVAQVQPAPSEAFTKIELALGTVQQSDSGAETTYELIVKNVGTRTPAEINFRSIFDLDTKIISVVPSQGSCRSSSWASSYGSEVCYLGSIKAGESATVKFTGAPSGLSGNGQEGNLNENWVILGVGKERATDPAWPVNQFEVRPLKIKKAN